MSALPDPHGHGHGHGRATEPGAGPAAAAAAPSREDPAAAFAAGAPVLVGDPSDPVVFVAAAPSLVDGARLEHLQQLAGGKTVLGLAAAHADRLGLEPMGDASSPLQLELTAPVDAAEGCGGGWSARDRAHTIRICADPACRRGDLSLPGHVHTARLTADSTPAGAAALALAESASGETAVLLGAVCDETGAPLSLEAARTSLTLRRLHHVSSAHARGGALLARAAGQVVDCELPTGDGRFRAVALDGESGDGAPDPDRGAVVALVHGDPTAGGSGGAGSRPRVHVHPACLLGDAFGSLLCDCGAELAAATESILAAGAGVIVYVKPGLGDPGRRYHCGRETPVDLAAVHALLGAVGLRADPGAQPGERWFPTSVLDAS